MPRKNPWVWTAAVVLAASAASWFYDTTIDLAPVGLLVAIVLFSVGARREKTERQAAVRNERIRAREIALGFGPAFHGLATELRIKGDTSDTYHALVLSADGLAELRRRLQHAGGAPDVNHVRLANVALRSVKYLNRQLTRSDFDLLIDASMAPDVGDAFSTLQDQAGVVANRYEQGVGPNEIDTADRAIGEAEQVLESLIDLVNTTQI